MRQRNVIINYSSGLHRVLQGSMHGVKDPMYGDPHWFQHYSRSSNPGCGEEKLILPFSFPAAWNVTLNFPSHHDVHKQSCVKADQTFVVSKAKRLLSIECSMTLTGSYTTAVLIDYTTDTLFDSKILDYHPESSIYASLKLFANKSIARKLHKVGQGQG